jgi:hypothetical protein
MQLHGNIEYFHEDVQEMAKQSTFSLNEEITQAVMFWGEMKLCMMIFCG